MLLRRSGNVHRRRRHDAGQSLVEFGLVALVSYLLLAAIIEFGRVLFAAQLVQDAARVGARELSLTPLGPQEPFPSKSLLRIVTFVPGVPPRIPFSLSINLTPSTSRFPLSKRMPAPFSSGSAFLRWPHRAFRSSPIRHRWRLGR